MNIKDLAPGSYQVTKQGTGAPLNIKNLAPGSYSVTPPAAPAATPKSSFNPFPVPSAAPINWSNPTEAIKGGLKSIGQAGVDLDTAAQTVGKQVLKPVGSLVNAASSALGLPGRTNVAAQGIPAFNPGTPQAQNMQATLTPNNPQQQTGAFLSNVAQAAIPVGSAEVKAGAKAAEPILAKLSEASAQSSVKKAAQEAIDVVMPKNTPKATSKAIAAGRGEVKGWLKTATLTADKATQQAARAVEGIVSKSKTGIENVNAVRDALGKEAQSLKAKLAASGHTFTPQELNKTLRSVQLPGLLRHNAALNKTFAEIVDHVISTSKQMSGHIGSVLDLRQQFDQEVERQFGDIYASNRDMTPVRQAVKATRDALNKFVEDRVPETEYQQSLHKQSSMYDAIENIAGKAADEVGTSAIGRAASAIKNHPYASIAGGLAAGYEAAKHL